MPPIPAPDYPESAASNVLVNMLWCVPGKVGGSEEYLVRQLIGLRELPDQRWRPTVVGARGLRAAHPELISQVKVHEPPFDSGSRMRRIHAEATWLRSEGTDAMFLHHGGGTAPLRTHKPYVLTVHDLQFRTYPQYFTRTKRAYLGAMVPRSVRRARVVTVPSEYVRTSVVNAYDVSPEKVMVVPHGVEPALTTDITPADELRVRYGLGDGPLLVYPAVTHPHKNHRLLLTLMREHWLEPELQLVLIGGVGAAESEVIATDDNRVRRLGRVPAADRNGLLSIAEAMVFPSEYEGFGAPLIEAMTLGTAVICSNATCMPAVVGDAGVVLPLSVDAWAGALDEVRRRRTQLVAAGRARAREFTSLASGAALAAAYDAAQ